jgi:Ni,Fe-hydrogenase I cytochrome b subunit
MPIVGREPWRIGSQVLRVVGAAGCLIVFVWLLGLIGYYSTKRPRDPDLEHSWTVPLQWTHTTYGTLEENEELHRLHFWFFPFFAVLAVGETIRRRHERNEPWRAK